MRAILAIPAFRRLFVASVANATAGSVLVLILGIWVKGLTDSNRMAAGVLFVMAVPLVFAPAIGQVVDRFRRGPLVVTVNVANAAVVSPLLTVDRPADVWIIYSVAVCYSILTCANNSAIQGLIKELVPDAALAEANGALQTFRQALRLVGPLGGAGAYLYIGPHAVVGFACGGFLISAVAIALVGATAEIRDEHRTGWWRNLTAGARHVFSAPTLRRMLLGVATAMAALGLAETMLFAYVDDGLGRSEAFLGVLVAALGAGGVAGGLAAAGVVRRHGEAVAAGVGMLMTGGGITLLALPYLHVGIPAIIIAGFGTPLVLVALRTALQRRTAQGLIGRAASIVEAGVVVSSAVGLGIGAATMPVVDYRVAFALVGVVVVGVGWRVARGGRRSPDVAAAQVPRAGGSPTAERPSST